MTKNLPQYLRKKYFWREKIFLECFIMKKIVFIAMIFGLFFTACDPKIDERAQRYDPELCPVKCPVKKNAQTGETVGKCRTCTGEGACSFCNGTGTRVSSTRNFTGEGINLTDYETACPFCGASGVCSHCRGTKLCNICDGTRRMEPGWSILSGIKKEN